jgi:glycosyltransferase involved in cell wall biosynthesis
MNIKETGQMAKSAANLDLAIIHLTIEGIAANGGGVCTVTRGHLATLPRVKKALAKEKIKLTPYFVETHFGPGYGNYDPEFFAHAKKEIEKMGGAFYSVLNSSPDGMPISCNWPGGEDFFGTIDQIKLESAGAASIARSIARKHDVTVVYCHDTFFILSPVYGTHQDNDENVKWIRVVHSTTLKHDAEPVDPFKIGAEFASFYWARKYPNVYIGAISGYISDHLVKDYAADAKRVVPTGNGVDPLDKKYRVRTHKQIVSKIREYNAKLQAEGQGEFQIPLDKRLILSFGRPVPYKRLDLTLDVAKVLGDEYHPVIVTLGEYPELVKKARKMGIPSSVINAFDFEFCACLSQYRNTVCIPILAYNEPFGLIPAEVRLLIRKSGGLLVVPDDGGGLAEQVNDKVDGFVARNVAKDVRDLANVIRKIDLMSPAGKNKVRRSGISLVFEGGYTWSGRILETLSAVLPEVRKVQKNALRDIAAAERAKVR